MPSKWSEQRWEMGDGRHWVKFILERLHCQSVFECVSSSFFFPFESLQSNIIILCVNE